jgi:hypothetical protein
MDSRFFTELVRRRTVDGRAASQQDYSDALRALADAHVRYQQLGDDVGQALAAAMMASLLLTQKLPAKALAY